MHHHGNMRGIVTNLTTKYDNIIINMVTQCEALSDYSESVKLLVTRWSTNVFIM